MSEIVQEVHVYRIQYICDKCQEGYMIPTNVALLSNPPQYSYKCNMCNWKKTFNTEYPRIEYQDIYTSDIKCVHDIPANCACSKIPKIRYIV